MYCLYVLFILYRNPNCPQCRAEVCQEGTTKLYFNTENEEQCENRLANLQHELELKDLALKQAEKDATNQISIFRYMCLRTYYYRYYDEDSPI
jgi:hypothetical protein